MSYPATHWADFVRGPVWVLPLRVLGEVPGTLVATWDSVKKNRSYALQYAIGDRATTTANEADWTTVFSSKPKSILTGLTSGTTYLFRVTTIGGKDGQSPWSPIVTRMAA